MMLPLMLTLAGCDSPSPLAQVDLHPSLEDRLPDGTHYTPSTQSFLRGHHWMDSVTGLDIATTPDHRATVQLLGGDDDLHMSLHELPLEQLVPRLHYTPAQPPDDFDAFNLMLAEFSRNGLSMPVGHSGDTHVHFETDLEAVAPWSLSGDYGFQPTPRYRPARVSVVNNCLASGLWEFAATDRTGELHHSWFTFPTEPYVQIAAATNGLPEDFVREATVWSTEPVEPDLDRLRAVDEVLGSAALVLAPDGSTGFSSQGSRRKLNKGFAMVEDEGELRRPTRRSELVERQVQLVDFVPPGKYALDKRRTFDLSLLGDPRSATVRRVTPHTRYAAHTASAELNYIELELDLGDGTRLVLGNLPTALLVPQEDFTLHGFGVGILSAAGLAERRALLLDSGPAPSFAYLLQEQDGRTVALNSHEYGVEQVFIRTRSIGAQPQWEITITSFERIVDLVRYQVDIPAALQPELAELARRYVSPLYLTYRDDNLR